MVHSLTLSYTLGSMRCDSQASFLARTLVNPYLGREPKARVATTNSKRGHEKLREEEFMGGFFLDYFSQEGEEEDDEYQQLVKRKKVGWMFGVLRNNKNEQDRVGNLKFQKNFINLLRFGNIISYQFRCKTYNTNVPCS